MKKLFLLSLLAITVLSLNAQKYMTRNGYIGFYSHTPIEDIKADNNQVAAVLEAATGELAFQVLIKSFSFEKALMQEHFNENYMESETYPKSSFKGKIVNLADVKFSQPGKYPVKVEGELTMHGVTRNISAPGELEVARDLVKAKSVFNIKPEDYQIKIPGMVRNKIAENIQVTVDVSMNLVP